MSENEIDIQPEDEFLKNSRHHDGSDDEEQKDSQKEEKPNDVKKKTNPFGGYGTRSQENDSEKIEINDERQFNENNSIKNSRIDQSMKSAIKESEVVNNNTFFKPGSNR